MTNRQTRLSPAGLSGDVRNRVSGTLTLHVVQGARCALQVHAKPKNKGVYRTPALRNLLHLRLGSCIGVLISLTIRRTNITPNLCSRRFIATWPEAVTSAIGTTTCDAFPVR